MAISRTKQSNHWKLLPCLAISSLFLALVQSAPNAEDWRSLNEQLQGRLKSAHPLAYPCFPSTDGDNTTNPAEDCKEVQERYLDASYRTSVYQGFFHTFNEACVSNATDKCLLSPDNPFAAVSGTCKQGLVSNHYVEVRNAKDVQAAFSFARRTGILLSIKASGHDYLGRSSIKGSLALWTRNLKQKTFHSSFQASGGPGSSDKSTSEVQAVTLGAGVNLDEGYVFADQNNVTLVGGSSPTVTTAGGWSLFGGHGALSPTYGMGADQVLEFTVVTPDGKLRTANANLNPDLFWALRGAGAGVFGVVLSATIRVQPATPLTFASISFNGTSSNQIPFLKLLIKESVAWAADGWGGPLGSTYAALVHPGTLNLNAVARTFSAAVDYAKGQQNGSTTSINFSHFPNWYAFYKAVIVPTGTTGIGRPNFANFRIVSKRSHNDNLLIFFESLLDANLAPQILQTTPNLYKYPAGSTSVHPAWRDSYWMVGTSIEYAWDADEAERKEKLALLHRVSKDAATAAPEGCVYPSESDPWLEDWQHAYWGDEYERLVGIKKKYDPFGLLDCWRCVGFDEDGQKAKEDFECWAAYERLK